MERKSECKISLGPCKPLLFYLELKQMILSYCSLCDNSHFYMPLNTLLKIPKALRRILCMKGGFMRGYIFLHTKASRKMKN